jgi:hypothetical protein
MRRRLFLGLLFVPWSQETTLLSNYKVEKKELEITYSIANLGGSWGRGGGREADSKSSGSEVQVLANGQKYN